MSSNKILVVGGAGYIGSHVCKTLAGKGYEPVTFDNLSNGHAWAVKWGPFVKGDIHNQKDLDEAFETYRPSAVIHLASSINVRESFQNPQLYYHNNLSGSLSIAAAMVKHGISSLVFSSSAAVYGTPVSIPIDETHPKAPLNPYGRSKSMAEELFEDFHRAYGLRVLSLRYFNAAGADPDGEIGESHHPETHLIPQLIETAQGQREKMTIYGNTFPTPDGTAIRDYVHVSDLALAHSLGIEWLQEHSTSLALNLGTGTGHSICEVTEAVERQSERKIAVDYVTRNTYESPILIASATKAEQQLGWTPEHSDLNFIVQTAWNWHENASSGSLLSTCT